jgi:carboxypeptidase Q
MDAIKHGLLAAALLFSFFCLAQDGYRDDSLMVRKIYDEALGRGECYANLETLCKQIGHRLSGSPQLDAAIAWGASVLQTYKPDSLWLQPVMVPKWTRGSHALGGFWVGDRFNKVNITALGGSIGTGTSLEAQVIEVKRIEDLEALPREQVAGKIVFFNRPMDPLMINTGSAYGGAFDQRSDGASAASRYGAVGTLVRSLTHALDTFPHTGAMGYQPDVTPIPAAAISTVDAQRLKDALRAQPDLKFTLELNCTAYADVEQHNVIAEIKGSTYPDEYIVVGGHLDSWDIGEGAHDDGAGIVHAMEVLRIFKAIGYQPKHSIRVVLYVNEENGNRGGETYAAEAKTKGEVHYAAVESDAGGFSPRGFST